MTTDMAAIDIGPPAHDDDDDDRTQVSVAGVVAALSLLYLLGMAFAFTSFSYDVWGGVLVGALLAAIGWPMLARFGRLDPDPMMRRLLIIAFSIKQFGTLIRYYVVVEIMGGDALAYHRAGEVLAPVIRAQDYGSPEWAQLVPEIRGTTVIRIITGIIYNFTGTSRLAGFMVFSFLAFWGMYLIYRAFRMALPEANHRRFAALLFLSPTLLFWPSSIGKDAWMLFTIGIAVNGAVRIYLLAPGGFALVAMGLAGSAIVRVHITAMLLLAIVVTAVVSRGRKHEKGLKNIARLVVTLAFLAGAAALTVTQAQSFFSEIADGSASGALEETQRRSSQGGSQFTPVPVTSPTGLPQAIITVMYRPFPNEANNIAARMTSLEGVILILFTLHSWKRLLALPATMRRSPLVSFAVVYTGLFVIAFSSLGNFGILARQRSQLYPLAFVLLALPAVQRKRRRTAHPDDIPVDDFDVETVPT